MTYQVLLVASAIRDLEEVHAFLLSREGRARADAVMDGLEKAVHSLSTHPGRGHIPPELVGMGIRDIREIHFKSWRILYLFEPKRVTVMIVADGHRNFRDLLQYRLLR